MIKFMGLIFLLIVISPPSAMGGGVTIKSHWKRPISVNPSFSAEDLHPEKCNPCHEGRYRDWSASLHSRSVGPGLTAQLDPEADPGFAMSCYFCHAPLSMQNEIKPGGPSAGGYIRNESFDKRLKGSGVSCASCHFRRAQVYGPTAPRAEGVEGSKKADHASLEKSFFERSEFCAACHQLDAGYRVNGKLLVNTYMEWKESLYGKRNITCQICHMPGRRHLFKGIHDPAMTKSAVTFTAEWSKTPPSARLTITNSGAGHYFPTYTTPQVVIRGYRLDSKGSKIKGSVKEAFIGRKLPVDLSMELFDTRIAPFKSFIFDYPLKGKGYGRAEKLVFEVKVYPDEFYNRFYKASLKGDVGNKGAEFREALKNTNLSPYTLFKKEFLLNEQLGPHP